MAAPVVPVVVRAAVLPVLAGRPAPAAPVITGRVVRAAVLPVLAGRPAPTAPVITSRVVRAAVLPVLAGRPAPTAPVITSRAVPAAMAVRTAPAGRPARRTLATTDLTDPTVTASRTLRTTIAVIRAGMMHLRAVPGPQGQVLTVAVLETGRASRTPSQFLAPLPSGPDPGDPAPPSGASSPRGSPR